MTELGIWIWLEASYQWMCPDTGLVTRRQFMGDLVYYMQKAVRQA